MISHFVRICLFVFMLHALETPSIIYRLRTSIATHVEAVRVLSHVCSIGYTPFYYYKNLVYKNMKLDFLEVLRTCSALELLKTLKKRKFMEKSAKIEINRQFFFKNLISYIQYIHKYISINIHLISNSIFLQYTNHL